MDGERKAEKGRGSEDNEGRREGERKACRGKLDKQRERAAIYSRLSPRVIRRATQFRPSLSTESAVVLVGAL